MKLEKSSHTTGESHLHLQFTIAYRRDVLRVEKMMPLVKLYLKSAAARMGLEISAIEAGPDHIHLFISGWKNYSISKIAQRLKGFTSRMIRKRYRHLIKYYLWGEKFWSEGYFYRTVGSVTADCVEYYIRNCQEGHWAE